MVKGRSGNHEDGSAVRSCGFKFQFQHLILLEVAF
ncbi:uncharacterized protein METZ01_LOCUS494960, partial [marine metagenome]